jgi:hypothetical protein
MDTTETPIACNLAVFTPEQRARHRALGAEMKAALLGIDEIADGYRLRYPGSTSWVLQLAEFITLERLCCPFFTFTLGATSDEAEGYLTITGNPQAKALLAFEMVT